MGGASVGGTSIPLMDGVQKLTQHPDSANIFVRGQQLLLLLLLLLVLLLLLYAFIPLEVVVLMTAKP